MAKLNVVTGAFGYSGSYIARRLLALGERVRTLTAHPGRQASFADSIEVAPFNFDRPDLLKQSLEGAGVLFNTYWIRFPWRGSSFEQTAANTRALIEAAARAGVGRIVHISITNASSDSPLPYFRGKGEVEQAIIKSGLSYAIIRPPLIFGSEDILLNNVAWMLRKFPVFAIPGGGEYKIQAVGVADLAEIAVSAAAEHRNFVRDAAGPEIYTFNELVKLLAATVRSRARVVHLRPSSALLCALLIGRLLGDVILTRDEMRGLMANLLVSHEPPIAPSRLSTWLEHNADRIGISYESELARRR